MTPAAFDPEVLAWLSKELQHEPPFEEAEVLSVGTMTVARRSGSLAFLHPLRRLACLGVEYWTDPHLDDLAAFPRLFDLDLWDCHLRSLDGVRLLASLQSLELNRCWLESGDLSPLLDAPKLRRITISGCPMNEDSWERVIPELLGRGVKHVGNYPMMAADEYRVMRAFRAAGHPLIVFRGRSGQYGVTQPGIQHVLGRSAVFRDLGLIHAAVAEHGALDTLAFFAKLQEIAKAEP